MTSFEAELMPNMKLEKKVIFDLNPNLPWFKEGRRQVGETVQRMVQEPLEILMKYSEYDEILELSPKDVVEELKNYVDVKNMIKRRKSNASSAGDDDEDDDDDVDVKGKKRSKERRSSQQRKSERRGSQTKDASRDRLKKGAKSDIKGQHEFRRQSIIDEFAAGPPVKLLKEKIN